MAEAIYFLCALTSLACAGLLVRSYRRSRTKLLLWSSICFVGLALNNVLLVIDLVIVPAIDLSYPRAVSGLVSILALLIGLIWSEP
jgi:hypothetical protein